MRGSSRGMTFLIGHKLILFPSLLAMGTEVVASQTWECGSDCPDRCGHVHILLLPAV